MLKRWFSKQSGINHEDPERRMTALRAALADGTIDPEQLRTLAQRDPEPSIRRLAVAHVQDHTVLLDLTADSVIGESALSSLATLAEQELSLLEQPAVLDRFVAEASNPALAIPYLKMPDQAAQLAVRLRGDEHDQLLGHPLLKSEAGLTALEKRSRNKNKRLNRHARDGLDALKQAKSSLTEAAERIAELDAALVKAHDEARVTVLETGASVTEVRTIQSRLNKLKTLGEEARRAFDALLGEVPDSVADAFEVPKAAPDLDLQALFDNDPFAAIESRLTDYDQTPLPVPDGAALAAFQTLSDAWSAAVAQRQPDADLANRFSRLRNLHERLDTALGQLDTWPELEGNATQAWRQRVKALDWPDAFDMPERLKAVQRFVADRLEAESSARASETETAKSLTTALAAVESALGDGHYADAIKAIKRARTIRSHLPKSSAAARDAEKTLSALSAQLAELKDWQQFATHPKRGTLLTDLEAIANQPLEPQAQAERLKQLRGEWQSLGRPSSKAEHAQQAQFDALAERAYAPCAEHYEALNAERAANLVARVGLCETLEAYLDSTDWTNADIKAAEQILRTARSDWNRYHPCDVRKLKPVTARFETLQNRLYDHIKTAWERNIASKEAIVAEAQGLIELAEPATKIERAKALQQQWQQVGPTPRKADQKLWGQFRSACDAIFKEREDAFAAERAERDQAFADLTDAVETLAGLAAAARDGDLDRKAFSDAQRRITELRRETRPSAALLKTLERAESDWQAAEAQAAAQRALADLDRFQQWDVEVSEAEASGDPVTPPHAHFSERAAGRFADEDILTLTLLAEIAAEIPSPETDQRMQLQVELMNAGVRSGQTDAKDLLQRFCSIGPKAPSDPRRDRFFAALKSLASSG